MEDLDLKLERADRLDEIARRVGVTLWQIQILEDVSAQCLVLVTKVQKGMGEEAGNVHLDKARNRTFGTNVSMMIDAGILASDVKPLLSWVVSERNWLVHRSRHENESAVYSDDLTYGLLVRLNTLNENIKHLMGVVLDIVKKFAEEHKISQEAVDNLFQEKVQNIRSPQTA